jgi:tetratricopeptide (TPR) repeat protein
MAFVCGSDLTASGLLPLSTGQAQPCLTSFVQRQKKAPVKTQPTAEQNTTEAAQQEAIAAFEEGQRAHGRGDLHNAIALYDKALDIIPDFPEALFQRGMAHLAQKQLDQAQTDLLRLVELKSDILQSPDNAQNPQLKAFFARAHSALGDIYTERHDAAKAEQEYRRAIELDATLQRATTNLVSLLIERNAFEEASARLNTLVEAGVASASVYSLQGYVYEQSGQSDQALTAYDKALALDTRDRIARQRRSRLRAKRQDYAGAAEDMAVVYEQDSSASHALDLGALYELAGKPVEAIGFYERVLKTSTSSAETRQLRLKLVNLLISVERQAEALAHAQQLMKESANDADTLARLGSVLLPIDPTQAAHVYGQALKLDEQNIDYKIGFSAALLKMRRYPEALAVALDVVKRAPENYYAHSNVATAFFQLQQFAQAVEHFKWIINQKPDTVIAHYFIGICYDKLMQYDRALPAYETFLQVADARQYQLETDNVKFRLPGVRRAIEKQRGKKR